MKRILLMSVLFLFVILAKSQVPFTTYQSTNPHVQQSQSTQSNRYPFTTYQSSNRAISSQRTVQGEPTTQIIKGVYLDSAGNTRYLKMKISSDQQGYYVSFYYNASQDSWVQCYGANVQSLGMYDDKELREYFTYKASISNIGIVYF